MNRKYEFEWSKAFYAFVFVICFAGAGTATVEAAEPKAPPPEKAKPSCSKACRAIKVTQSDGTTVQCGGAAQGSSGCLCKCGDTVVSTPPK